MLSPHSRRSRFAFALSSISLAACVAPAPGFAPDDEPSGARLVLTATVDDDAPDRAHVIVTAHEVPDVFGVSFHVVVAGPAVLAAPTLRARLGDESERVHVVRAYGDRDLGFGGTRVDPALGDVVLDGALAELDVRADEAGTSTLTIAHAFAKDARGAVLPLRVAGGAVTLGAP